MWTARLLQPLLRPPVRQALRHGDLGAEEADAILEGAFRRYARQRRSLPREPNPGGRLMVRLAALTACLYQELVARDIEASQARALTARITEAVYAKMTGLPTTLARRLPGSPRARVAAGIRLMRTFPFGPPAYDMRDVDAGDEVVGFDVHRCPTAEYFRSKGLGELCVDSWCNLDYALAHRWGADLERGGTLAGGAERCDFRFRVDGGRS